ncbi:transcription factor 7 isoform X8 [Nelusetta ayraudi]|uniref:transcription factor 7 isoform X8 n=1 Tax=Nelusetta ayraudi TaxID=303726 RepID=UPI003F701155
MARNRYEKRHPQAPVPGPLGLLLPAPRGRRPDHSLHGLVPPLPHAGPVWHAPHWDPSPCYCAPHWQTGARPIRQGHVYETSGGEAGERAQEAGHQETPQRLHALHEGDEGKGHCRVHVKGERRHQPDPGTEVARPDPGGAGQVLRVGQEGETTPHAALPHLVRQGQLRQEEEEKKGEAAGLQHRRKKKCIRYLQGGGCPSPSSSDLSAIDSPPSPPPPLSRHRPSRPSSTSSPGCSPPPPSGRSPPVQLPLSPRSRSHVARLPVARHGGGGGALQPKLALAHPELSGGRLSAAKAAGLSLKVLTETQ